MATPGTTTSTLNQAPGTEQDADRLVGFLLKNDGQLVAAATLYIRPEDLNRPQPFRVNVTQTLGKAWVDEHGEGIVNLTISGHTGYGPLGSTANGFQRFKGLRDDIFSGWKRLRADARANGRDPNRVQLVFIDETQALAVVVVPVLFVLRRSRTRPMLYQYAISMTELGSIADPDNVEAATPLAPPTPEGAPPAVAVQALETSRATAVALATDPAVTGSTDTTTRALGGLAGQTAGLVSRLQAAMALDPLLANPATQSQLALLGDVAAAGRNLVTASSIILEATQLPGIALETQLGPYRQLGQMFGSLLCNARGALGQVLGGTYLDLRGLAGASNCSSTNGGSPPSPYASENVFAILYPPSGSGGSASLGTDGPTALAALTVDPIELATVAPDTLTALATLLAGALEPPPVGSDPTTPSTQSASATTAVDNPFRQARPTTRRVASLRGETIQRFAGRVLGDAGSWQNLVALNGLRAPYLTDDATLANASGGTVVLTGAALLVPDTAALAGATSAAAADNDAVYFRDFLLQDGDFVIVGGDLATVGGYDNLAQGLALRLDGDRGDRPFRPLLGTDARRYLGLTLGGSRATLIAAEVERTLVTDPRVASVQNLVATVAGDVLTVSATAVAVDGTRVQVSSPRSN